MRRSKVSTDDSDRKMIVLYPIPGIKYFKLQNCDIYVDIELFKTFLYRNGSKLLQNTYKNLCFSLIKHLK